MRVTVYSRTGQVPKWLLDGLRKAGFNVEIIVAEDVDDIVIVGSFGKVKGIHEARIVLNQLTKN